MAKAGLFGVLAVLVLALIADSAAASGICTDLQTRLTAIELADRQQWEGAHRSADPYAIERERLAVLEALAANRCQNAEAKRKRPNRLFAGLFGNRRPFRPGRFGNGLFGPGFFGDDLSIGTYRTLCVRSCDGYYFPISYSAGGDDLRRDELACRALCPGQVVSLYVQRNPSEEGGTMVSLAGEPYTSLSTAFRYRREYDRGCACGPVDASVAAAFEAFAVAPPTGATVTASAGLLLPLPTARPREDDPETLANRDGSLRVAPVLKQTVAAASYQEGPDGKVVRLVGPPWPFAAE